MIIVADSAGSATQTSTSRVSNSIVMLMPASSVMAALQAMLVSQNMCISYAYDKNGNRATQVNNALPAQAVWGTSSYPCFVWGGN